MDKRKRVKLKAAGWALGTPREFLGPKRVAPTLPPPVKFKGGPLTTEEIEAAINEGRE